ncbi:hypothetical protein ACIF6L_32640 [Kitasatospora sp. NPDC086009]|uniref:hypothetical protein n=1 Tax=unclassified Kitasatospora TaxID=2633591 RepID=UPI0037CB0F34
MHASLAPQPLTVGPVRSQVSVFGDQDEYETAPRVAVQMTLHLTFAEILGRLLFTPSALLMHEDLEPGNESKVIECLWFTMAQTGLDVAEDYADMAMDIYTGRRASNLHAFTLSLGTVITHIFGVTSPEAPAAAQASSEMLADQGAVRL